MRVAREAVGPEGQVVPQQWLVHTTAPGVPADDRRRSHRLRRHPTGSRLKLRCHPRFPADAHRSTTALRGGERWGGASGGGETQAGSLPRTRKGRPAEAGRARGRSGRPLEWRRIAVRQRSDPFARVPAPPTVRQAAAAGGARRWWSVLSVAVQAAVGTTALGQAPCISAGSDFTPLPLDRILEPGVTSGN